MNNKKIIIILLIIILVLAISLFQFIYEKNNEENLKYRKYYSKSDSSFYLQDSKLFILDKDENPILIPGDFSQMNPEDYYQDTYQSNIEFGNIYFYYKIDGKIFLVISKDIKQDNWNIRELTNESIGIPKYSEIKYIRISGRYGYIFYINPDGIGKILKSDTEGNYWQEINTNFELNDNCKLKFLNQYGMAFDGFLTVPSDDGEKCDLYRIDNDSEETLELIDITTLYNSPKNMDYYSMPEYYIENSPVAISVGVGKDKNNMNLVKFVSLDDGYSWMTEAEYKSKIEEENKQNLDFHNSFDESIKNLDSNVYLIEFENYNPKTEEIKISEKRAKEIAEIGFKESASRIAGEGIDDTENEFIKIEDVYANNYFTRKYSEGDFVYTNVKRKAYVVTKENDMGNGVSVYVDVSTGLIIGGDAFGD